MKTLYINCILIFLLFSGLSTPVISFGAKQKVADFSFYYNLSDSYRNINSDSVVFYANKALKIADENSNFNNQITALVLISKAYIKIGSFNSALLTMNKAINIVENKNLFEREKECLINLGTIYQAAGYVNEALKLYVKAQAINEYDNKRFIDKVDLNYFIGSLYLEINKIKEGREHLRMSSKLSLENDFEVGALSSLILLSSSFDNIDSINYYTSLSDKIIAKNPQLSYAKVVMLNNKALISKALGHYLVSKLLYEKAIDLAKKNKFYEYLASLYNNYSYLLMTLEKNDSAEIALNEALSISKRYNFNSLKATIYDSYSDYLFSIKDFENAYQYKDTADIIEKRIEKNKQIKQSLFLSTVFETEKKEKEILAQKNKNFTLWVYLVIVLLLLVLLGIFLLYSRQKLQLNKARVVSLEQDKKLDIANALIEGQDAERKRLAMDLHDGLGASLGTLRLAFDSELNDNVRYHELTNLIDDIRQTVRDMSHRMMPTRLDKLGLIPSINNLAVSLSNSGKFTVDFKTNINKRLSGNMEINLYYLIFELVNNALRHSNGNTIFVELIDHDDLISLSVIDNGTEFKSDEFSDGMGLKNVKARIQYMDGELNVDANGQETIFMVEIPMKR